MFLFEQRFVKQLPSQIYFGLEALSSVLFVHNETILRMELRIWHQLIEISKCDQKIYADFFHHRFAFISCTR